MITSLMAVWAAAAAVFLMLIATTSPAPDVERSLQAMALIALTVLAIMLTGYRRLPWWTPDACGVIITTIVGWTIVVHDDPTSPYSFAYLWLAVHASYFLHWKRAILQIAYVAVNYALALSVLPGALPVGRWTTTLVTAIVICSMIALLRREIQALLDRLAGLASTDALTGLRNRRAYEDLVAVEIARADRTGQPLTALMGDVDHFKRINDRLGHSAGDEVLRRVARVLARGGRRIDVACRIGGEEFVLLLPATDATGGCVVAERLRRMLAEEFRHSPVPVSMSFGVASYPVDAADAESLLCAVDTALLAAKRAGRDRTFVYSLDDSPR